MSSEGKKYDVGKTRYDLLHPSFIEGVASVLTCGAHTYGDNNWQEVENARERYYAALMRHTMAWRGGELLDGDTKLSHMYHVGCNAYFLSHFDKELLNAKLS